jgi:hypothetical protein
MAKEPLPALFPDFPVDFLTVYWMTGWFGQTYEIWKGTLNRADSTDQVLSFTVYLVWPLTEDPEECLITIRHTEAGLVFTADWFPDEDFAAQAFFSPETPQIILHCTWERESIFLHLK